MRRRELLLTPLALEAAGWSPRWAICSETFVGEPFPRICALARETGYQGLEIEPSNLSPDPAAMTRRERAEARRLMRASKLVYVGFHSFLKAPKGLHLTSGAEDLRRQSWDYFGKLVDLAADLGERPVMVLGSSKQRQAEGRVTPAEAVARLKEGLRLVAPRAEKKGVTVLIEPLAPHLCNVVNSVREALEVADAAGSGAVHSMLDTHNTAGEKETAGELMRRHQPRLRHVHLNEMDGRYPGSGSYDFGALLKVLRELQYGGWVSVEVFDFQPDGTTVARRALEFLKSV
jgi:D-psicose/D-tagatose/L-ribulose 3-epimerase